MFSAWLFGGLCALALAAAAAGGVVARPYNPDNLAGGEAARVGQVCESVVRVQPGEEHYDNCVESLSDSLQSLGDRPTPARPGARLPSRGLRPRQRRPGGLRTAVESRGRAGAATAAIASRPWTSPAARSPTSRPRRSDSLPPRAAGLRGAGLRARPAALSIAAWPACRAALFAADNPMN